MSETPEEQAARLQAASIAAADAVPDMDDPFDDEEDAPGAASAANVPIEVCEYDDLDNLGDSDVPMGKSYLPDGDYAVQLTKLLIERVKGGEKIGAYTCEATFTCVVGDYAGDSQTISERWAVDNEQIKSLFDVTLPKYGINWKERGLTRKDIAMRHDGKHAHFLDPMGLGNVLLVHISHPAKKNGYGVWDNIKVIDWLQPGHAKLNRAWQFIIDVPATIVPPAQPGDDGVFGDQ